MSNLNFSKFIFGLFFLTIIYACSTSRKTSKLSNNINKANIEFYKEYSAKLGYTLIGNESKRFVEEVYSWLGTPYKYGGSSKQGTDCSGFIMTFYKEMYHIDLNRSAVDLVKNAKVIDKKDLSEGNLIFFKINSTKITHVGMYISNNKFVHASVKRGVTINDLDEAYYLKYYFCCGKIIH